MKPLILLDIDGVLNPVAHPNGGGDGPDVALSDAKVSLVRRLSRCGRIAWVSTSPEDLTAELESQLQLEMEPLRVELAMRESDVEEPTPKLRAVTEWLAEKASAGEADWDAVVWIDDVLGPDAHEWADGFGQPVLLEKTSPEEGLTKEQVASVESFLDGGHGA
ncbi:HAD domain-containing protein [Arthrobacter sp. NPDC093125]|uniref:HAD domain-containing protein n=1 Tax=Arthrobacter sp. NPDC093125 TaxID=3363944 RepID=UPI003811F017